MVRCWNGYRSGARCRFAYGLADLNATHHLLLWEIQIGFGLTFLIPAHSGSPSQNPESHKTAVVVVVVVVSRNKLCFVTVSGYMYTVVHKKTRHFDVVVYLHT